MTRANDHLGKRGAERAEREWLTATEEGTGQQTLEAAQAVARGDDPPGDQDDPVVNGYRGGDRRVETPTNLGEVRDLAPIPRPGEE